MSLMIEAYAHNRRFEVFLPELNNTDYVLILPAEELKLKDDVRLHMEVVDHVWKIRFSNDYHAYCNNAGAENSALASGMRLSLLLSDHEEIALLVLEVKPELCAYDKYRILQRNKPILIGKSEDADIFCANPVLSKRHALISFSNGRAYIEDMSVNGTFLGAERLTGNTELKMGDTINLYALSIYYLGDYLAISSVTDEVAVNPERLQLLTDVPEGAGGTCYLKDNRSETKTIHIAPRNLPDFYSGEERIENIPPKQEGDQRPAWMSILPSLTMVIPMVLGVLLLGGSAVGLIMSGGSAILGAFWATKNYRYAKQSVKDKEVLRLQRYEEYLVRRADEIRKQFEFNQNALREMYVDAETCSGYTEKSPELWARRANQSDFLSVRVGSGDLPFQVKITAPEQEFTLQSDELAERPSKIGQHYRTMRDVPICVDLLRHNVIGILSDCGSGQEIVKDLLVQIAATHCYTDVKLAVLFHGERKTAKNWEFVRWLPHNWNEDRSLRYYACNGDEGDEMLYALMQVLRSRAEQTRSSSGKNAFLPHYVLFVEDPAMLETSMIRRYLFESAGSLGITTVILADSFERLPSACDFVLEDTEQFHGAYEVKEGNSDRIEISFDQVSETRADAMARRMASMRVSETSFSSDIPSSLTFLDMMHVRHLEELDVLDRWRKNRTYESMRALIGQKAGGADFYLDLHEKAHGPHGLVAGTTGSGKSETLQTYIVSLAINFSPQDVGFFIIDFKGGGMANLFSNLPHMLGQISNLSGNQVRRAMVSIQSENHRRQRLFNEYGVNKINDYTKLVKSGEATTPLPHLLIIIDEFAELKREEPEFMKELISVAQVGRSLGVHLILATQKPSGTVDDNIWSNSKFKLCLRVADKQDSNDMLHRPDAAYITHTGRGYLLVGQDEYFEQFQSGWSGAAYNPTGQTQSQSAILVHHLGNEQRFGKAVLEAQRQLARQQWLSELTAAVWNASGETGISFAEARSSRDQAAFLLRTALGKVNARSSRLPENAGNLEKMQTLLTLIPADAPTLDEAKAAVLRGAEQNRAALPEEREITQLEATVNYLAELAAANHFTVDQQLWMPVLPTRMFLEQLSGYGDGCFNGSWPAEKRSFSLHAPVGLVDYPEEQKQFPLEVDFAEGGHLALAGSVTSGKSTFLQTMLFSFISHYSPKELSIYLIDYSSQMLACFENAPHTGGVVLEGEDDRLDKLFGLLSSMLAERKRTVRGGNFSQFVQVNGYKMPAVIIAIDGYANFREKTENRYEANLMEIARDAEGYGIYLVTSSMNFGAAELQTKIAEKMRQGICLEMSDRYAYGEILRRSHFEVRPETNVKGRGLAVVGDNVLEFQTALSCDAENDYARSERIAAVCSTMRERWTGLRAKRIPEIPEKPTWKLLKDSDQFPVLLEEDKLPVAYVQQDASLYALPLKNEFSYLVLGSAGSGKSTFLRNIVCTAAEKGGRILFADKANESERKTADAVGADYFASDAELFDLTKQLLIATNERGGTRKSLMERELENDEIYAEMKQFRPIFCFFADFHDFLQRVYSNLPGIGRLAPNLEPIFAKGKLLNVFFFAALDRQNVPSVIDKPIYRSFVQDGHGAVLGGEVNRQTVFPCGSVKFSDQGKRMKPGTGYGVDPEDNQTLQLIVVPQNRGGNGQ